MSVYFVTCSPYEKMFQIKVVDLNYVYYMSCIDSFYYTSFLRKSTELRVWITWDRHGPKLNSPTTFIVYNPQYQYNQIRTQNNFTYRQRNRYDFPIMRSFYAFCPRSTVCWASGSKDSGIYQGIKPRYAHMIWVWGCPRADLNMMEKVKVKVR
jgi:hypothetical protein